MATASSTCATARSFHRTKIRSGRRIFQPNVCNPHNAQVYIAVLYGTSRRIHETNSSWQGSDRLRTLSAHRRVACLAEVSRRTAAQRRNDFSGCASEFRIVDEGSSLRTRPRHRGARARRLRQFDAPDPAGDFTDRAYYRLTP